MHNRLKNYTLVICLFVFLFVIIGGGLHLALGCVDGFGNNLSGSKMLLFAISFSLKGQFYGDDIGCTWHRMTMPFQLSVWCENDLQH